MEKIKKIYLYIFKNIVMTMLSPTYSIAKILNNVDNFDKHSKRIKFLNTFYLSFSMFIFLILYLFFNQDKSSSYIKGIAMLIMGYYCFSRVNEIFIAFLHDSIDKIKCKRNDRKGLKYYERVRLAFGSYIELILDYGIIYYILNSSLFHFLLNRNEIFNKKTLSIIDTIYYSGVTITTLGYGDFLPVHPICKIFSVYEVINGMLLIVVCFTVYVSLNFQNIKEEPDEKTKNNNSSIKCWLLIITIVFIVFAFYSGIKYKNIKLNVVKEVVTYSNGTNDSDNTIKEAFKFINSTDTFNWFFSAAAQTIAAFVGFLLAGYSLVHNAMDSRAENNEELKGIYHDLKKKYFKMIKFLFLITGSSIVCNLLMLILNGTNISCKIILTIFTIIINLTSVVFGIVFIFSIIDPEKIERAAREMLRREYQVGGEIVDESSFIQPFIRFERELRDIATQFSEVGHDIRDRWPRNGFIPLVEIISNLYGYELISREESEQILEIISYRNLVVHGNVQQVSVEMINRLISIMEILNRIRDAIQRSNM